MHHYELSQQWCANNQMLLTVVHTMTSSPHHPNQDEVDPIPVSMWLSKACHPQIGHETA